MPDDIDDLFTRIRTLAEQLERLPPSDPNRARLEADRDHLRRQAAELADAGRHPESVARQIEALEARRSEIEGLFIKKGYSERSTTKKIQDPGAYSHNINALLRDEYGPELESIQQQLDRLSAISPRDGADSDIP
jgi:small-conductance mechanosensitive channel